MTTLRLFQAHRKWMTRDRTLDAPPRDPECPPCAECGCLGNNSCGHECLETDRWFCALDAMLVCPCCKAGWREEART